MTADELAGLLQELGGEEAKAQPRRRFENLVVQRLSPADRQQLAKVLGIDPGQPPAARAKAPRGVDLRKPLSEQTADQVVRSLSGPRPPRPEAGKPAGAPPAERSALVVAYRPVRPQPTSSKEVKQFLSGRKEHRPDTVQLLLVLHENGG
jgi:hypothetical protein